MQPVKSIMSKHRSRRSTYPFFANFFSCQSVTFVKDTDFQADHAIGGCTVLWVVITPLLPRTGAQIRTPTSIVTVFYGGGTGLGFLGVF